MSPIERKNFATLLTPSRKLELVTDEIDVLKKMIEDVSLELYINERGDKGVKAELTI